MIVVSKHMGVMREEKKHELWDLYSRLIFPHQGLGWDDIPWVTHWGVTYVTMWDDKHLLKNIQFAMIQEMMGIGPTHYCIINNVMPNFQQKVMLLINYLSMKKMCICPQEVYLGAPFDRFPWSGTRNRICNKRLHTKSPLLCTIFYTQQFVVFIRTVIYGPLY